MNTPRRLTLVVALIAALVIPTAALAQDATASAPVWGQDRGFEFGLKYLLDGIGADEADNPLSPVIDDIGSGAVVSLGYTFVPKFHLRLSLGGATHQTDFPGLEVQRSVATFEAHYRFMPDRQVCPYILGSLGGTDATADQGIDHVKFTGGMAGVGAGLLVGFTRHLSMDLTGRLDAVNWTKAEWSQDQPGGGSIHEEQVIEESGGSARLELGLVWAF